MGIEEIHTLSQNNIEKQYTPDFEQKFMDETHILNFTMSYKMFSKVCSDISHTNKEGNILILKPKERNEPLQIKYNSSTNKASSLMTFKESKNIELHQGFLAQDLRLDVKIGPLKQISSFKNFDKTTIFLDDMKPMITKAVIEDATIKTLTNIDNGVEYRKK